MPASEAAAGSAEVSGPEGSGRRRSGLRAAVVAALVMVVAMVAVVVWNPFGTKERPLRVESTQDIGALNEPEGWFRDGSQSAPLDGRLVWVFGDTLFATPAADGKQARSNTGAWSDPAAPLELHDPKDADGLPVQLIPFDELEAAYNDLSGKPDDRIAVWPGSIVPQDDGTAAVFFEVVKVSPGLLNYSVLGSGLAAMTRDALSGGRDPNLLFHAPEPAFHNGAVEVGGSLYVHGCAQIEGFRFGCRLARVPSNDLHDRSAYTFWDGEGWSRDYKSAAFTLEGPADNVTVSFNEWLGSYLAVYSKPLTNQVVMRTAPAPQGPWSEEVTAFSGLPPPPDSLNYGGFEHPELSRDGGRTIVISYFHPLGPLQGEIRLVEVRLY